MSEFDLSPALIQFIAGALPSYDAAVVLVHVSREPEGVWTVERLVEVIGPESMEIPAARRYMEHFARAGLLEVLREGEYRLGPQSDETRAIIEELRLAYDERPVTLVRAFDSAARAKIQSFADAFRLKRD
jgi:hypothetical protein